MSRDDAVTIRSFRVVFALERRIHKVDRIRLPLPYGLPLRSIAYALLALAAILLAGRLPLVGLLVDQLPTPVRLAVLPAGAAYLLTQLNPDGRAAHWYLVARLRLVVGPRRWLAAGTAPGLGAARLDDLTIAPDERGPELRAGVVAGPAEVLFRQPFAARERGRRLEVEAVDAAPAFRARRLALAREQEVVVRWGRR